MGMTCSTMANEKFIQISTYRQEENIYEGG